MLQLCDKSFQKAQIWVWWSGVQFLASLFMYLISTLKIFFLCIYILNHFSMTYFGYIKLSGSVGFNTTSYSWKTGLNKRSKSSNSVLVCVQLPCNCMNYYTSSCILIWVISMCTWLNSQSPFALLCVCMYCECGHSLSVSFIKLRCFSATFVIVNVGHKDTYVKHLLPELLDFHCKLLWSKMVFCSFHRTDNSIEY